METATAQILQVVLGAGIGLVYGLYGFLTKRDEGEPIKTEKLARTILLFAIGGSISAVFHDDISEVAINSQVTTLAATVGLAFDMAWSYMERQTEIPETIPAEIEVENENENENE